jgi:hypothetical protein
MLIEGHTYMVRVRGFVYNTWSDFNNICQISISAAVGDNSRGLETITSIEPINIVIADELLAYPNPFENQSGFMVKSTENRMVVVYLFDAIGRTVWSKQVNTNQYQQFSTVDFNAGLYYMSTSENKNNAIKMIKTK